MKPTVRFSSILLPLLLAIPRTNKSSGFSGGWHKASKLILCAVMLRGRHRGLPVALDRAVRLPDDPDRLGSEEEQDFQLRRSMSMSMRRQSMNAV